MNWVAVVDKEALYLNVPKYLQTDDCEKDRTFVMQKKFLFRDGTRPSIGVVSGIKHIVKRNGKRSW